MLALGIVAVLAASAAYNGGVVLQALDAREEPEACGLRLKLLARLLRRRRWLWGTALSILAFPLQVLAYANAPLSVVQPGLAVGLVLVLFLGSRYMGEKVQRRHYAAVVAIIAGVAIIAATGPEHRQPDRGGLLQAVVMGTLALGIVAPYVLRRRMPAYAAMLTVSAGVAFAWGDIATKLFGDGVNGDRFGVAGLWLAAVIVSAIVATLTLMTAFQHAQVRKAVPGVFAVETALPIVLAPLLLQHNGGLNTGDIPTIAIGLALVIGAIVTLAGSAQVSWAMAPSRASHRARELTGRAASRARSRTAQIRRGAPPMRTPPASSAAANPHNDAGTAPPPAPRTRPRR
jgi:drug/metabolite transporter (DMT)-like permease